MPLLSASEVADLRAEAIDEMSDLCTVQSLTYNAPKKLYEPPYINLRTGVPCKIASLASMTDPDVATYVQTLNISFETYRQITLPVGLVTVRPDYRIVKEPVGAGADTYLVVQAVAPDETSPLTLRLHCRKL